MTDERPWLSIVTVVKDDLVGLQRTRDSLSRQDLSGTEWVVLDGSANQSAVKDLVVGSALPAGYAYRPPTGVYSAMNAALAETAGKYVWFVNAGDEVAEGATMSRLRAALTADPLWLIGQVTFVDGQGRRTTPPPFDYEEERQHLFARGRFAPHQGTIVRAAWLRAQGGFPAGYVVAADYWVSLKLSMEAPPSVIPDAIAVFHTGGLSALRWRTSVAEFHRARVEVLQPSGTQALAEHAQTAVAFLREAAGAGLRRLRPTA